MLFQEFIDSYNNVLTSIKRLPIYQQEETLRKYIANLEDIELEKQFRSTFWEQLLVYADGFDDHDYASMDSIIKSKAFEALKKSKELLEKCKLIVQNPAFGKVLS